MLYIYFFSFLSGGYLVPLTLLSDTCPFLPLVSVFLFFELPGTCPFLFPRIFLFPSLFQSTHPPRIMQQVEVTKISRAFISQGKIGMVYPGPELLVSEGESIKVDQPLTSNHNVGGFGQGDAEIVLQDPLRVQGLLMFLAIPSRIGV